MYLLHGMDMIYIPMFEIFSHLRPSTPQAPGESVLHMLVLGHIQDFKAGVYVSKSGELN